MLLNILWVTGACFTLTFNCPIQISKFFHKTSPVRCPLPAHLIKSVHIEKNSQSTKTSYWSARGQTKMYLCISRLKLELSSCLCLSFSKPGCTGQSIHNRQPKQNFDRGERKSQVSSNFHISFRFRFSQRVIQWQIIMSYFHIFKLKIFIRGKQNYISLWLWMKYIWQNVDIIVNFQFICSLCAWYLQTVLL